MKKFFALSLAAMLAVSAVSCGSKEEAAPAAEAAAPAETAPAATEAAPAEAAPAAEAATYTDGVYTGETEPNSNGMKAVANVTVAGGVITAVELDEIGADGSVREVTVETTTNNPTVGAQLDELAAEIVKTNNNVVINADGLVDTVTGCTMHAQPYVDAVNAALAQAQ